MQLQAAPQDLVRFVKTIVLSFASLAERRDVALTFDSSVEVIDVWFGPGQSGESDLESADQRSPLHGSRRSGCGSG